MNEIISAIQEHLQRQLKASQLDYYQVLGLEPFCSDRSQIESALQAAWGMFRKSEQSHSENNGQKTASLQIVNKLLKQAQTILLDTTKKTAYDSQLAKLFEAQSKQKATGQGVAPATTASIAGLARTSSKTSQAAPAQLASPNDAELLPAGDPMQPYLAPFSTPSTAAMPAQLPQNLSVDKRREELAELFPSLMMMSLRTEEPQEQFPAWLVAADRKPSSAPASIAPSSAPVDPTTKAPDLVTQLRKRRQRRNLLAVGTMVLVALGLLGFATFRFVSNRVQVAKQDSKNPRGGARVNEQGNSDASQQADVQQGGGKAPELVIAPNRKGKNKSGTEPSLPALPSVNRGSQDSDASGDAQTNSPAMADSTNPDNTQVQPEPTAKPTANPADDASMKPEPMPDQPSESVDSGESDQWKKSMNQARALLVAGDIQKFEEMYPKVLNQAVTKVGKAQSQRLDQAGQLYKIYMESFAEAKVKAKGASSLKVGAAEVSIVETTPEKLVIRSAGQNKTYEWDKLPFGIAVAISDLGLSESAPVDMAARAIYFSLHPFYQEDAKKGLVAKRIDGWFEKSVGKESVRPDLKEFVTDKYE